MSVTIEQDLKEVLGEINQKLENINSRLTNLEVRQFKNETHQPQELTKKGSSGTV